MRFGQIHRNTFINSPTHLDRFYRLEDTPRVRLAGQITGVEGYLESAATGLAVGLYLVLERRGARAPEPFPATTAWARSPATSPSPTRGTSSRPTSTTVCSTELLGKARARRPPRRLRRAGAP